MKEAGVKLQVIASAVSLLFAFQCHAQTADPIFPKGELIHYQESHGELGDLVRETTGACLLQSSRFHHLVPFHLGKVKSSTSALTRSF
jgi:hypothetical protein